MKRIYGTVLAVVLEAAMLTACSSQPGENENREQAAAQSLSETVAGDRAALGSETGTEATDGTALESGAGPDSAVAEKEEGEEKEMKGNQTDVKNGYDFKAANPELEGIMNHFIEDEVKVRNDLLTEREKQLISLVSLVCQQSDVMLKTQTEQALAAGVTPVEIKEAVYHCSPYIGFPRAVDAAALVDQVLLEQGVELPLESQARVTGETRFEEGLNAQATIFGDFMRQAAAAGPEHMPASSYYLVSNCFGDYYTRGGLDLATREMLTLSMLVNLGTESQIKSHISGNVNMGRDKEFLSQVLYQCLPYTGYPRLLNAMNCLNEVIPDTEAD